MAEKVVRIIPLDEVREANYFSDLADLAEIFNHEIVESDEKTWRWAPTAFFSKLFWTGANFYLPPWPTNKIYTGVINLNDLWGIVGKEVSVEEMVKVYMRMGFPLSGFCEVFSNPAEYYDLPDARPVSDKEYHNGKHQSVIDWLRKKYKGQVLKNL